MKGSSLKSLVCSSCRVQNCKFRDPRPKDNFEVKSVKLVYFFKKKSSLLVGIYRTRRVYSKDGQGSFYQNF